MQTIIVSQLALGCWGLFNEGLAKAVAIKEALRGGKKPDGRDALFQARIDLVLSRRELDILLTNEVSGPILEKGTAIFEATKERGTAHCCEHCGAAKVE